MDTQFGATLLAVIEEGSIAAAARRLRLTPGAVGLRIKALEAELGTGLLARAGRRVVPTPAATRLVAPLRQIVCQSADLKRLAAGEATAVGELRLGIIASASTGLLPPLLKVLTRDHPALDLLIQPGTSFALCEQVLEGKLDGAIVVEPPTALRKGETFTAWVEEPLVLIVPPHLAATAAIDLIRTQPFIRYDARQWGGRIVDRWLRANGLNVRDWIELDALDGIVALVSAGLGVAVIPDWAGPRPEGTVVATLPLPPPAPVRRVGLYRRRLSSREPLMDLLERAFVASRAGS